MRVRIHVDFELSSRQKRLILGGVCAAVLLGGTIVYANVPNTFKDGDALSAQTMNDNFTALDTRLAKMEALSAKQTFDGGMSVNASYCGASPNTPADLSALSTIGTGYAKARTQCQTTCSSPTAHMCSGEELTRAAQLGTKPPSGWYTTGANLGVGYECFGFTSNNSSYVAPSWSGGSSASPSQNTCNTSYPVLCCD